MKQNKHIKILIMDVDGTLTDGKIYMSENGEMMKAFDIKDGYALHEMLPEHGITPIIITGRESKIVENRAKELGITKIYQGVNDKLSLIKKIITENAVTFEEVAYIGDDISDLECLKICGIGGCPADAVEKVRDICDYVSTKPAGSGAVRDFSEYIIRRNK